MVQAGNTIKFESYGSQTEALPTNCITQSTIKDFAIDNDLIYAVTEHAEITTFKVAQGVCQI